MSPGMDTPSGAWGGVRPEPASAGLISLGQSFYGWFTGNATGFWFSPFTGFRSLHPLQPVLRQTATVPHKEHQGPTARFGRTGDVERKNPMLLYFKHLHPSTPAKRPEKAGPSCYNANRKLSGKSTSAAAQRQVQSRRRELETTKGDDESGDIRRGARLQTCRVAIRLSCPRASDFAGDISLQHVFAAGSTAPASLPPQPLRRC